MIWILRQQKQKLHFLKNNQNKQGSAGAAEAEKLRNCFTVINPHVTCQF